VAITFLEKICGALIYIDLRS